MSISVQEFRARTWVISIGISDYASKDIQQLPSSSRAAAEFAEAFRESGVPSGQVRAALEASATTRIGIRDLIASVAGAVAPDGILILFFSGHGVARDADAHLICSDSQLGYAATMLSAGEISALLDETKASGILLLIDTCQGAGIAEQAPSFFRTLGKGKFRIILSSSGANEPSHQPADGSLSPFCKHLCAVVRGTEQFESNTGEVRLGELAEHLQSAVDEDARELELPSQQVIFSGVHGPDPLLFVQANAKKTRVVNETRYTWRYIRRQLRTYGTIASVLALLCAVVWYVVLESTEYIALAPNQRTMLVERGFPGFNGLPGYPKLVWEFDDAFQQVPQLSEYLRSKYGSRVISDIGRPVMERVLREAEVRKQATLYGDMGRAAQARKMLLTLKDAHPLDEARRLGLDLLGIYGTDEDLELLRQLKSGDQWFALPIFAKHDEALAEMLVQSDRRNGFAGLGLNFSSAPCPRPAIRYLSTYFAQPSLQMIEVQFLLDAATRLRCPPSPESVRIMMGVLAGFPGNMDFGQSIANYMVVAGGQDWSEVVVSWAAEGPGRVQAALYVLRWLPQTCAALQKIQATDKLDRQLLSEEIAASCPVGTKNASTSPALLPEAILAAYRSGALTRDEAEARLLELVLGPDSWIINWSGALDGLQSLAGAELVTKLKSIVERSHETRLTSFQVGAVVDLLWRVDPVVAEKVVPAFNFSDAGVFFNERGKLMRDPRKQISSMLDQFGHPSFDRYVSMLMATPLTAGELQRVRTYREEGTETERSRALSVLAVRGSVNEVASLLLDPRPAVRSAATAFAAANPEFDKIVDLAVDRSRFPNTSLMCALLQRGFKQAMVQDLAGIPKKLQHWRRGLASMSSQRFLLPPCRGDGISFFLGAIDVP